MGNPPGSSCRGIFLLFSSKGKKENPALLERDFKSKKIFLQLIKHQHHLIEIGSSIHHFFVDVIL